MNYGSVQLDIIKKYFNLKSLTYDYMNQQILNESISVGYTSGYNGFFGPPIYNQKCFYMHKFNWQTDADRKFTVIIEPTIDRSRSYPKEHHQETLNTLSKFIKDSLSLD